MSSTPVANETKAASSQQNPANSKPASGTASPFNYAAAAAKTKQQQSGATSPADGASRASTPGGVTPPVNATNGSADTRRQSAVSMAKAGVKTGGPGAINFGSVHDSSAALSSSPAVQPKSGQHLQGDKPALFGSVEAANESKQKVVGFAGKDGAAAPGPRQTVDFQKLFQGANLKTKQATAPVQASGTPTPPSSAPPGATAATSAPQSDTVSSPSVSQRNGASGMGTSKPPSTPASAGASLGATPQQPTAGAQPFEPAARSPSQHFNHGARGMSGGIPPFQPQGAALGPGGPQQARSPHLGQSPAQQPMMNAHASHWQYHAGQPMYHHHMAAAGYPYYPGSPHAAQWAQQQQPSYEGSPRVSSVSLSHPSSIGGAPSTPASMASPASTRAQAVPFSPSTPHSSIASPPASHGSHIGLGHPGNAPRHYQMPSGSFGHAHTPSYGANPMSPAARQFEPTKRPSSAIRIVNPNTNATVDLKAASKPASTSTARDQTSSTKDDKTTAAANASPASANADSKTPAQSTVTRPAHETQADFAEKVARAVVSRKPEANESNQKEAQQKETQQKEAQQKEAQQKEVQQEEERKKKAAADMEAARLREEEEKAAAAKKAAEEEAAKREAARKEEEAREAAAAQEKAAREKAEAEAAAVERQKAEEEAARKEEEDKARQTVDEAAKAADAPLDNETSEDARLNAEETVFSGDKKGEAAGKDAVTGITTSRSVADIERMAREASSVPSTPLETSVTRTPLFPTTPTPRTPGGTPGFAGLPAKPMSTLASSTSNGSITLDSAQLEKRRRPAQLDTAAAQRTTSNDAPPMSAASQSLGSARFIDDLTKVAYPESIQSPKPELNQAAEPGKFRYDRDFLLQFMGVYSEKPQDMPSLASIGMEQGQMGAGGRGAPGRRASQMGGAGAGRGSGIGLGGIGGSTFGRGPAGAGGMGQFDHPAKTSEERFAQSNAGVRTGGAFGASGPMGNFSAGSRTQPLSRGGSGSGALPSREMMGTGVPAGGRTTSRRGRQREAGSGRGGDRVNPPEKGGPTIPLDQVVPLAHSDNRWQAGSGNKISSDSPEMVQRKVKSLLNKLTVEKFASISDQILDWANKSTEETDGRTLRQVIALIFEKATDEAAWSEMYAQLCRKLQEKISPEISDENLPGADGKPVSGGMLFRKYLLNRCQEDFERGWAIRDAMVDAAKSKEAEDKAKQQSNEQAEAQAKEAAERGEKTEQKEAELMSDEYYAAAKAKRRGLGLVRFIGELFKLSMLTERIMHICIKRLMSNATDPEEEEIESLCKLLTTVGRQLDNEKARRHIDIYFQRITEMSQSESINSRMRFMILDVIELRAAGWRGKQEAAGPKSIAQIHEDAAKQKMQAEAELAQRARGGPPSRGGSRRGQQRGDFPGPGQAVGPDGWTSVGNAPPPPRPTRAGDMSAFGKIERSGSGRPLSMGPNNFFAKKQQKSSEDGSKPPSRTSSSANMFAMLGQAESEQNQAGGEPQRKPLNIAPRSKPLPGRNETAAGESEEEGSEDEAEGEAPAEGDKVEGDQGEGKKLTEEDIKRKIDNDVKEFLEVRDVTEGVLAMESLPASSRAGFLTKIIEVALNKKEDDVRLVGKLLSQARESSLLTDEDFETSFKDSGIAMLDDIAIDVPQVYTFTAILLVASRLSSDKIEALADTIEGEGITTPKQKLLAKVEAVSQQ